MTEKYKIQVLASTRSTNDDAKQAAMQGEAEGLVIHAREQTAGKGRHGRTWESPEGNLHLSILLRPDISATQAAQYGFAAALAIHDTVQVLLPQAAVKLKWPNDVLVDGKKISGILLETASLNDKIDWLVIGIGINVAHFPSDALYPATSLQALGSEVAVPDLRNDLLKNFSARKEKLEKQGFPALRKEWLAAALTGKLSIRMPRRTVTGKFAGLDDTGGLILQLTDGSKQMISAGDVFLGN